MSVFKEWDIDLKDVKVIVTDNAPNMIKAIRLLNVRRFGCAAHSLHLVVSNALTDRKAKKPKTSKVTDSNESMEHYDLEPGRSTDTESENGNENEEAEDFNAFNSEFSVKDGREVVVNYAVPKMGKVKKLKSQRLVMRKILL